MDPAEVFVFDLGWAFFAAWGMILATLSLIAFGRDLLSVQGARKPRTSTSLDFAAQLGLFLDFLGNSVPLPSAKT